MFLCVGLFQLSPGGLWIADSSAEIAAEAREAGDVDWTEEHGDRRQELVFIGTNIDQVALETALLECLLTDAEMGDRDAWLDMSDPFPITCEEFIDATSASGSEADTSAGVSGEDEFVFI